jgi:hypothetical protein
MTFMMSRRGFVSLVSVAGLGIATFQPDLAHAAGMQRDVVIKAGTGQPLAVAIPGTTAELRDRIQSLVPARLSPQLDWRWSHTSAVSWAADNVQSHIRYTPSPFGAKLPDAAAGWPNAAVIEQLPYGVLVHQEKARRAGVRSFDLAGMRKRGLRPLFPFSGTGSAPENGWMLPTLASVVSREPAQLPGAARTLSGVVGSQLAHLDLRSSDGTDSLASYRRLLDPKSELVAMYGSPLLVQAAESERGPLNSAGVLVVSLQDFLHIPHPSLFASSMLQAGSRADADLAQPVMKALREPQLQQLLTAQARYPLAITPNVDALMATHKPGYYKAMPELSYVTDGGLLAGLVIDIQAALIWSAGVQHKDDLEVAQYALSQASSRAGALKALGIPLTV